MRKTAKLMAAGIAALAIFLGTSAKAQDSNLRLGIGLEAGVPTGNATTTQSFVLGGTARLQIGADKGLAYTITSGYYSFMGKDFTTTISGVTVSGKGVAIGIIPVKAGIKAYFSDAFYFGAEAGAGFVNNSGGTRLLLAPALGYSNSSWDIGARYEYIGNKSGASGSNFGMAALRVAYGFGL